MFYSLAIRGYSLLIHLASFFSKKAKLWVEGRRAWRARLSEAMAAFKGRKVLWVHAASLGEFEQGRPVMEAFRKQYPDWVIVLSFFSPSGYEVRKHYPHADVVCYLPTDTPANVRDFLDRVQPQLAIFIKYEFWYHYLTQSRARHIPALLISALFRPSQPFFKPWGGRWREMLDCFTHLFVQDEASAQLLQGKPVTIAGDTRVDRVIELARSVPENERVAAFVGAETSVLVVGSSWPADEAVLFEQALPFEKIIIAPHQPDEAAVNQLLARCAERRPQRYSDAVYRPDCRCLIIDNVGMLNTLYRYGKVAYIGGGFGKGIHNTLEPAAYGLPVVFGPKYRKFEEARQFVAGGGAFSITDATTLNGALQHLQDPVQYQHASEAVTAYLQRNSGATARIMAFISEIL